MPRRRALSTVPPHGGLLFPRPLVLRLRLMSAKRSSPVSPISPAVRRRLSWSHIVSAPLAAWIALLVWWASLPAHGAVDEEAVGPLGLSVLSSVARLITGFTSSV